MITNTANQMWRLDVTDPLTVEARNLADRLLVRLSELPDSVPDDVKVRYFRAFLCAIGRMHRRARRAT